MNDTVSIVLARVAGENAVVHQKRNEAECSRGKTDGLSRIELLSGL